MIHACKILHLMKRILFLFTFLTTILLLTFCSKDPVSIIEASFTYACNDCEIGDTVQFSNTSTDAETFDWDFGDGTASTEENPEHIYSAMGTYTVRLTVSNANDSDDTSNPITIKGPSGLLIHQVVYSEGIEGNLLGDSPYRNVTIYLPPGYESSGKHYPVVYLLHGFQGDNKSWFGSGNTDVDLEPVLNDLINTGTIEPMIVVSPDSHNRFLGSWYLNSVSSGNWEDFIVKDVVEYLDENYRTIPNSESRGIAGFSMGGYGAMMIAMKHADVFSAVYTLGASILVFESPEISQSFTEMYEEIYNANDITDFYLLSNDAKVHISLSVAVVPNPSATPFYCDFIYSQEGQLVDSVVQRCYQCDPYSLIQTYQDNLLQLSTIMLDCGDLEWNTIVNIEFAEGLSAIGIEDTYVSYPGGHGDNMVERTKMKTFPLFSEHLVHEDQK